MDNPICRRLGIRYPILLGGMARVGTAPLAAAVSEAGGLGILGATTWGPDEFREQIRRVRAATDRPFGANIPVSAPHSASQVQVALEEKLPVVTTSAGDPARYTRVLKDSGIYVLHVVPMVDYALLAQEAGVDAVIAEGSESGGFTSLEEISTLVLVPQVVDAVRVPVLAAGGIGDGRGLAAALALGAVGVQVGTRFLATKEAEIPGDYKLALVMAKETDTRLLRTERAAARLMKDALRKRVDEALEKGEAPGIEGSGTYSGAWAAGQVAGLIREIVPAAQLIEEMVRNAAAIFRSQAAAF